MTSGERAGASGLIVDELRSARGPALRAPLVPQWPLVIGAVPQTPEHFQRRSIEVELERLSRSANSVAIMGLGGVGKSTLAAHHVWNTQRRSDLDLLLWVGAANRQAVITAYSQAAGAVLDADTEGEDAEGIAQRFLTWLGTTNRRWLIVLDDVSSPGELTGLWPPEVMSGQVVVTTRHRDPAWAGSRWTLLDLGTFTERESAAYLLEAMGRAAQRVTYEELAALAQDLGHLPLALALAAAYLIDTGLPVADYRAGLAGHSRAPAADKLRTNSISAVCKASVDWADTQLKGLALPLLQLISVLDGNGIPMDVLVSSAVLAHLNQQRRLAEALGRKAGARDVRDALRVLQRLGLLSQSRAGDVVRIHPLIQSALQETIHERGGLFGRVRAAADALTSIWPEIEHDQGLAAILRANAYALQGNGAPSRALWIPRRHRLLFRLGRSLGESGAVSAAVDYYTHLTATASQVLGPEHPDTLSTRNNVAIWRGEAGDVVGAVAALEELLADSVRILGPDHPDTLTTRNNLARWRGEAGDVVGAVAALEELLADRLRILGPDHPDTLTTRNNLARWRGHAGDAVGAVSEFEELLADSVRILGPDHPATLATRNNVAIWRGEAGDVVGAVAALEELLADRLRILGPDHPDTLTTRNDLARWRGHAGDAVGAVSEFEELLADSVRILGPDHPATLATRNNVAIWRGEAGDVVGAVAALEELLADRLRILGPDHPDILATRSNLARWRGEAGDVVGAVAALEELLADSVRILGPDHPATLATRNNVAIWRGEAGDVVGAVAALEELLADRLRILGPDHPDTLATRSNLARWLESHSDLLHAAGRMEEALSVAEEAVAVCREVARVRSGSMVPELARPLSHYSSLLHAAGRMEEALSVAEEAVAVCREVVRANRDVSFVFLVDFTVTLSHYSVVLRELGRAEEALAVSNEALTIRRELMQIRPGFALPNFEQSPRIPMITERPMDSD
ncbi:tetratricopeptide repeat protein [Kitasatospora sp. NBC_00374]|uniref:tetratricopeptide repeat protein n=1 Tax=Kitasatospora sp. NBC_00374 TaxID=2975964 RepID=UPI0032439EC9